MGGHHVLDVIEDGRLPADGEAEGRGCWGCRKTQGLPDLEQEAMLALAAVPERAAGRPQGARPGLPGAAEAAGFLLLFVVRCPPSSPTSSFLSGPSRLSGFHLPSDETSA